MKKTVPFFMLLVLSSLLLVGWEKKKSVDLLADGLINLNRAIEIAKWGVNSVSNNKTENNKSTEEKKKKVVSDNSIDVGEKKEKEKETVTVTISGKKIYCVGKECSEDDLKGHLVEKHDVIGKIELKDDYAEAHVYHRVDDFLTEFCKEQEYEYDSE